MSRRRNPFSAKAVLLMLLVGAGSFLLFLYAIGQGWTGGADRNGGEHAASTGLTGFAGFYELLETTDHTPSLSRSPAGYDDYGLLVLTPPHFSDPEELASIIENRQYYAPTLLVLPKWMAMAIPEPEEVEAEEGWVYLIDTVRVPWFAELGLGEDMEVGTGATRGWNGFGMSGDLPAGDNTQALVSQGNGDFEALVIDSEGDVLAARFYADDDAWPLVVVFEPDLMNNYGMADETRARLADQLIHAATEDEDMAVVFDLTLSGLGSSQNLLTLAFTPPFLAATLCLLLAALVIAWRGFRRFGPPLAEEEAFAQGKRQLAMNGAALLGRLRRFHLLGEPYAALVGQRIAGRLGLREHETPAREAAIDRALVREGHEGESFAKAAHDLRNARSPAEILRASRALRHLERMLTR